MTILPIKQMKADDMEMRKRIMARVPNRDGEEEVIVNNPDSSSGIYVTTSVEAQCRLISQNRNMKEEENIKNTKVNDLKRAAYMNQHTNFPTELVTNPPNYTMDYEYPSTPLLLQVLLSLSTDTIKDSYQHLDGKMGELTDLKKRTVEAAIVQKWGERIWVMVSDTCVP